MKSEPMIRIVWPAALDGILLASLTEMAQIRRRLSFSHRHQQAIGAQEIDFLADGDIGIVLRADELAPVRPRVRFGLRRRSLVTFHGRVSA